MRRPVRVCALAILTACGPPAARSPDQTLRELARAIRERRADAVWALLSAEQRSRLSVADVEARLRADPHELRELAAALERPDDEPAIVARVVLATGDAVDLTFEDGAWRIDASLLDYYDQSTPRAALRSFVRAVERGRYDVVLRLVPDADREGLDEDQLRRAWSGEGRESIERLVAILRSNLDRPIEVVGDTATMAYGDRFVARLVREDGRWKIEDPD
ncbi:MAG: hypothetical protein NZ898_16030 [Myxococcota bacterium]|nr:hypothetical protein [Myxococcota bacterium]